MHTLLTKNSSKKIALAFLGLLVALLFSEFYTRISLVSEKKLEAVSLWQPDSILAQSLKPSTEVTLNSRVKGEFTTTVKTTPQGFRDTGLFEIPKPPDTYRILMLGDSFAFGYGVNVDETFPEILEKNLAEKLLNKKVEVINASFADGTTWDEYYLFLKVRGLAFQPDLIIETVFLGNDIDDLENHDWIGTDEGGLPTKIVSNSTFVSPEGFLLEKERAEQDQRRIRGFLGLINQLACDKIYLCKIVIRPTVDQLVFRGDYQDKNLSLYKFLLSDIPDDLNKSWQGGQKLISATNDLAKKNGSGFVVVNIPIREQIYDPKGILKNKQLNTERLGEFLKTANIANCDLGNVLAEKPAESYFKYDAHFTKTGNLFAAQGIEICLKDIEILQPNKTFN